MRSRQWGKQQDSPHAPLHCTQQKNFYGDSIKKNEIRLPEQRTQAWKIKYLSIKNLCLPLKGQKVQQGHKPTPQLCFPRTFCTLTENLSPLHFQGSRGIFFLIVLAIPFRTVKSTEIYPEFLSLYIQKTKPPSLLY